jgi:hypothetical protein
MTTTRHMIAAALLMASAGWALAQSSGTPSGTTGGATTSAPSGPAPATGATGGASSTLNPPSGTPPSQAAPTGSGVFGTLNPAGPATTGQADVSSRPCNPAAVGATGGSFGTVTTVPPDSRTAIASERTGPTNPSNTGANLNPAPSVGGGNSVSPEC